MAEFCKVCNCKIGLFTGKVKFLDGSVCTDCYKKAGYSINNLNEMALMGRVTVAQWQRQKSGEPEPEEFRVKCNTCGHLFCYSEHDVAMNVFYLRSAQTSAKIGAFNTLVGNSVIGASNSASAERDLDKVKDFSHCPKCNSTSLRKLSKEEFEAETQRTANAEKSNVSSADEIKKFKELLDMGVITQEEFDAKKKQLLGL